MVTDKKYIIPLSFPLLATGASFLVGASFFTSTIFFLVLPALYLSYRRRNKIKKCALFAFVYGLPFTIMVDYIMSVQRGWFIPRSIIDPHRLFGLVTLDMIVWGQFYLYFLAIFYEVYFAAGGDGDKDVDYSKVKYLAGFSFGFLALFLLTYVMAPAALRIDYFYLKSGLVLGLAPLLWVLLKAPRFHRKFFWFGLYFSFFSLFYEITAVALNQWTFNPAQSIGWVGIFGIGFPLEELFFWVMLGAVSNLAVFKMVYRDDSSAG